MAQDQFGNYIVEINQPAYTPGASSGGGLNGSGPPDDGLGNNGDTYVNTDNGDVYIRYGDTWHVFQGPSGGSGEAGFGSPEGVVSATIGTTYVDVSNGSFYYKIEGSGPTGWFGPYVT